MKYCRACKLRAKDNEVVCSRCGGELGTFGAAMAATGGSGDAGSSEPGLVLQGQIRELQRMQKLNLRRGRQLAIACAVIVACLLLVAYEVYARTVLSYAVLENVQIEQDPAVENKINLKFNVVKPGKVAFDRRSGTNHTEKLDVYDRTGPVQFAWSWPSERETGIDFEVIYRGGWTRTFERKHFNLSGRSHAVDIIFLLDTTGSMTPFINGLRQKCIEFADVVKRKGHNIRLGLIGFGDVRQNEQLFVLEPTADVAQFQGAVAQIPRTEGGDIPESGIEALQKALELSFRPGAKVCFIHITDAPCHGEQRLSSMGAQLQQRGIITFVVSRNSLSSFYAPICVNGGTFHGIDDARFEDVLLKVAGTIANQIGTR